MRTAVEKLIGGTGKVEVGLNSVRAQSGRGFEKFRKDFQNEQQGRKSEIQELNEIMYEMQTDPEEFDPPKTEKIAQSAQMTELEDKVSKSESECRRLQEEVKNTMKFESHTFVLAKEEFADVIRFL